MFQNTRTNKKKREILCWRLLYFQLERVLFVTSVQTKRNLHYLQNFLSKLIVIIKRLQFSNLGNTVLQQSTKILNNVAPLTTTSQKYDCFIHSFHYNVEHKNFSLFVFIYYVLSIIYWPGGASKPHPNLTTRPQKNKKQNCSPTPGNNIYSGIGRHTWSSLYNGSTHFQNLGYGTKIYEGGPLILIRFTNLLKAPVTSLLRAHHKIFFS